MVSLLYTEFIIIIRRCVPGLLIDTLRAQHRQEDVSPDLCAHSRIDPTGVSSIKCIRKNNSDHQQKHDISILSSHLHVLLGILQVLKECIITPHNATFLIGRGVRVSLGRTTLLPVEPTKIRSLLVCSTSLDSVALRALGLEDLGTLRFVTLWHG